MYSNKLAVALKSAGKVLREFKDEVYVPFGSEYSIFIKNLNSVRALVTVFVDGTDIGDGTKFVIDPNDTIDLERFIKNGNFNAGNRFKFIERTKAVEDHRGIGIEDGLVRVEFQFESKQWTNIYPTDWWSQKIGDWPKPWKYERGEGPLPKIWYGGTNTGCSDGDNITYNSSTNLSVGGSAKDTLHSANVNNVGITAPGSVSNQKFVSTNWFPVEDETHVIVLKILGETEDKVQVKKPVTVKAKPTCSSCGRTNKANAKFCTECGTSLQIV